jgi:diguanylate cyclase (GGDEF)-like protein
VGKGTTPAADPMFTSYAGLANKLLDDLTGQCLLDGKLCPRGQTGRLDAETVAKWLRSLGWSGKLRRPLSGIAQPGDQWLSAIPLEQTDGTLLGVFCVQQPLANAAEQPARQTSTAAQRLKPVLDCLHRELAAARSKRSKTQILTERTVELEWLFKVMSNLKASSDDPRVVEELLSAATERLHSALGALIIPDKRLCIEHARDASESEFLRPAYTQTQQHLLTWAQRQNRPLVINGAGRVGQKIAPCKILSAPIVRNTGRVIGVLAFFNPTQAADYSSRDVFLARHLGRETAAIVETQFDLMTGLYTRDGLEQMYGRLPAEQGAAHRSVVYIDIDHMHVVNELHGFELGNELIVRIADLVGPPLLPDGALAARIAGDRLAIILPDSDPRAAAKIAEQLQTAAARLVIGPSQNTVDVSISCGVAALVSMPQGLARALAAAELACKTAKNRGRNRVELYACEDDSMMRRHDDVVAVGQLRSAFKADRLLLYAQRIAPLQNKSEPGGYEILLRLRDPDGSLVAPASLIVAAQRYQLLPSVDRWVVKRALQMLAPYRGMLKSRGISMSINVSGQSIGDEAFIREFTEQLAAVRLPPGSIMVEITEQAAVMNLARANDMIRRLTALGCRFALDDFGTGANSLTYLKTLQIARVKIDGSFVRDIVTDPRSQVTVRAIVELAQGFSIDTVAEYVENEAIAEAVRQLGVAYAQGYAFGKPEPLDELLASLGRDESRRLHKLFLEL